jgi:replicative DNA helicase
MTPPNKKPKKEISYTVRTARSVMKDLVSDIKSRKQEPELSTGIPSLDQLVWGIHKSEVQVVAARTSQGKSSMVLQWAIHLALQGKKVLFVSLEMTNMQVMERILCSHAGISGWDLRRGLIPSDFDSKVQTLEPVLENLNLFLVDDMGREFQQIRNIFNSMEKSNSTPDVVFLDYINLVSDDESGDERLALKRYMGEIADFAKVKGVAVVVVAQINRNATTRKGAKPTLADLKGSGVLEEIPATVMLLHWQRSELDPEATGEFTVIVGKARHGPVGEVALKFNAEFYRYEDVPIPVEAHTQRTDSNGAEPVRDITEAKTETESVPF